MVTFIKKSFINCSIEQLFDFHLNTQNLTQITPKDIKLNLLTHNFTPKQSAILEIISTKYFVPTYWKIEIEKLDRPNILVDKALKSPFKSWVHEHRFENVDGKTQLIDIINFEMPFGFIGKLIEPLIKKDLEKMFNFRHTQTKNILEK